MTLQLDTTLANLEQGFRDEADRKIAVAKKYVESLYAGADPCEPFGSYWDEEKWSRQEKETLGPMAAALANAARRDQGQQENAYSPRARLMWQAFDFLYRRGDAWTLASELSKDHLHGAQVESSFKNHTLRTVGLQLEKGKAGGKVVYRLVAAPAEVEEEAS